MKSTKKSPILFFLCIFLLLIAWVVVQNLIQQRRNLLLVPQNKGMAHLQTVNGSLIAVFQDGQTCLWDWSNLNRPFRQFKMPSDRAVILADKRVGTVTKTGKKLFVLYNLIDGNKFREIRVGSVDEDVQAAISPNRKIILVARKIPTAIDRFFNYEFMTLDLEEELLSPPVGISITESTESIVDFTITDDRQVLSAGMTTDKGRLLLLDMNSGRVFWNRTYDNTKEFCSVAIIPDHSTAYAGSRDGCLYKVDLTNGDLIAKIPLLREGETREVTNDISVLNLSTDSKGQYVAATITPVSYIIDTRSDTLYHRWSTAHKLSSKIAFSPDNKYVATSDIRAGWPIDIWELEKLKK